MINITWLGHSSFKLQFGKTTILTDPYDSKIGLNWNMQNADIVSISHDHSDHNNTTGIKDEPFIIKTPGEYEIKGVNIFGMPTYHDNQQGKDRGKNIVFSFEYDGLSVCHLGDLGHELTNEQTEYLNVVNVLLIPVGGIYTINASTAVKVVSQLEPNIVIPMHYQTKGLSVNFKELSGVDEFLKEMGAENVRHEKTLSIKSASLLPEETEVVVLETAS